MQTRFSTCHMLGYGMALTMLTSSAMAVLPTVALDPADPMNQAAQPTVTSLSPSSSSSTALSNLATATLPITQANPAASQSQVQKLLLASVVARDAAGNEVLNPITAQTRLASGNVVEYHGYVINRSPDRVRNLKVTFNLPANTELTGLPDMSPTRAYGSVDGTNFQYMPLKTNVGGVVQDIPMSAYKAVQWDVQGLGLNEVAEVKYRVRIK